MIAPFTVVDTSKKPYPASDRGPAGTNYFLHLLDQDKRAPMRQMPKFKLHEDDVAKYGGGQLNGKSVIIAVREMAGIGNPTMTGEILEVK